ncbi:MAG: phosphoribosylpyrophosphate synthetase, partial [Desulfohalobiaceae bacterium]|nr:phosphoribosylpyrophosphate synthetase [Desulfohalobiaceae bacterium]
GATHVYACVTHPVLSGPAIERINNSKLNTVVVTDTIPLTPEAELCPKIEVVSVAELFAEAIKNINQETSISGLFSKV